MAPGMTTSLLVSATASTRDREQKLAAGCSTAWNLPPLPGLLILTGRRRRTRIFDRLQGLDAPTPPAAGHQTVCSYSGFGASKHECVAVWRRRHVQMGECGRRSPLAPPKQKGRQGVCMGVAPSCAVSRVGGCAHMWVGMGGGGDAGNAGNACVRAPTATALRNAAAAGAQH